MYLFLYMNPVILAPLTKKVSYVIHASDIHIRTGDLEKSRYREYEQVFDAFVESISHLEHLEESVLVLTGDIFHHKGKIEPAGIRLAQKLLTQLLEHIDVCMICGNHDYRQDNPDIPDLIETIYQNYIHHKVHTKHQAFYLNKTGHYLYHNIGFTVVDVRDTLKQYNTFGRKEQLDCFPPKCDYEAYPFIDYPIALFHGTILPSRLVNNLQLSTGYELSWFDTYEYVMLGDNHRMQWTQDPSGKLWGYPGSLIQQDFGEHFLEHGYLRWDLAQKTISSHTVFNDYGYCTVRENKGVMYAHIKHKTWTELGKISRFPRYPSFRVFSKELISKVDTFCKQNSIQPQCILHWTNQSQEDTEESQDTSLHHSLQQMEELNTTEKWFEYLGKYTDVQQIRDYILHPELLKLPVTEKGVEFLKKYQDRNDKIQKVIDEYVSETTKVHTNVQRVELVNMSWAYLMCYGGSNHFEFQTLKKKIALLNGKNAMGKSSFLDILCIALYGEPTKMRHLVTGKKYTDKIIHDQRPANKVAPFVKLLFRIGKDHYEIYRSFGTQAAKNKEHLILQTNVQIYKITISFDDTYKTLLCEGSTLVDRWIEENIGSMDSVLMSTMICQIDLNNFFHLKQDDQKTILDKALRLDTVSLYGKILRESILAHQDMLQQIKTAQQTVQSIIPLDTSVEKENVNEKLYELDKRIEELHGWKTTMEQEVHTKVPITDIPDTIEQLYHEAENTYLEQHAKTPISPEDLEKAIIYREKLDQVLSQLDPIKDVSILKDDEKQLKKWKQKYTKFLQKEPKCNVKMEWIQETLEKYHSWTEQYKDLISLDLDKIEEEFMTIEQEVLNFVKIEKPLLTEKPYSEEWMCTTEEEYVASTQRYDHLLAHPIDKNRTLSEYEAWKETYEAWISTTSTVKDLDPEETEKTLITYQQKKDTFLEKDQEVKELEDSMNKVEKELESLQEFAFNPDCWACQKNPFQHKKSLLMEQQQETISYYKQVTKYIQSIIKSELVSKWDKKINASQKLLTNYQTYITKKDLFEKESIYWEEILDTWQRYDAWKEEIDSLQTRIQNYEYYQLSLLWKRYHEQEVAHSSLLDKYHTNKDLYDRTRVYKKEFLEWEKVLQDIEQYKDVYKLYEVWIEEQKIIQEHLEAFEKSIQKRTLENLKDTYEKEYLQRKDKADIYKQYEKLKNMYLSKKLFSVEEILKGCLYERESYLVEKAKLDASEEMIQKHKDSFEKLRGLEKLYEDRVQKIKELDLLFMGDKTQSDGYKEWIYKNQVIPLLNKEMNAFLKMFENFSFEMVYEKKNFIYLVEDRGNKPTLDKASGYQNFIIGLALRIILTRIGAVGQQLKHLFIDEGFTACDSVNIEKVPLLLESILRYGDYESIVLMSHLDSVRECSHINIDIERKDPFSTIQYGLVYPELCIFNTETGAVVVKKGRGRPKKV